MALLRRLVNNLPGARKARDLNKARFEGEHTLRSNLVRYGIADTAGEMLSNMIMSVGKHTLKGAWNVSKLGFVALSQPARRFTWGVLKGSGQSLHATGTATFHTGKRIGKLLTQKDPNHILGRSINPIAGDLMVLGGIGAGLYLANRSAQLNTQLGSVDIAPIEGTMGYLNYDGSVDNAINSPGMRDQKVSRNLRDISANGELTLALHKLRNKGFIGQI